jgi:hypothetical protein
VVSGAGGTPTGTVTFKDGTTTLGAPSLVSSTATFTTSSLTLGGHSITANYGGDSDFAASASTALNQAVGVTPTTTTLISSANPSPVGQTVTFTAVVSGAGGTPTGTVIFTDGTTTLAAPSLISGTATFTTSSLALGSHPITANYGGDSNFATSASAALNQAIGVTPSTTILISSANPSPVGQVVTFTAVVSGAGGTPTGAVTFKDGTTTLGAPSLISGTATFTISSLALGSHSITANYGGDSNFATSSSTALNEAVVVTPTFTVASSSGTQSVQPGESATYTITVTPQNGSYANPITLAASGLPAGATASFSVNPIAPGSSAVTSMLTIQTPSTSAAAFGLSTRWPLALLALLGVLFVPGRRYRRRISTTLLVLCSLAGLASMSACGGAAGSGSTVNSYSITVTASSSTQQQTTTVRLTVQ